VPALDGLRAGSSAGESVPRFGALDRNFPAGTARRRPGAKIFLGAENPPIAATAGHREVAADRCAAVRSHAMQTGPHAENPCATGLFEGRRNFRARHARAPTEGSLRLARAETVGAAMTASAPAIHHSLSGVAVFLIVL